MVAPSTARATDPKPGPPLSIARALGPIVIDGDLSDEGWKGLPGIATWFETNVGDNVEPQVSNVAYLAYDEAYLYAGFVFADPHPEMIRAPLGDHDALGGATDYGGVIVDSHDDGKTARMFLANPRGLQYDAVSSDVTGEDNSPDFYWSAAGKITPTGWNLEIRIPFSSLRYSNASSPTWGLLLYRNYPRDRHYQFFTARLPRDVNCFICNSSKLTGLAQLPHGSHLVVAPFATAERTSESSGELGTPLDYQDVVTKAGVDVKWNPLATTAIDGTINPDFSQVESDVAQIAANERFALFYPEKRPFFLEGVDLFSAPFQAVYTRTVTSPSAGLRATGTIGTTAYTALVAHDRGGGSVIIPGPQGSDFADQDFESDVGIVRLRHDIGQSFVSLLATDREIAGGGHNRVIGPDAQWRPRPGEVVTGQALWSESLTPDRPDLTAEWDGRKIADHALLMNWAHNTAHVDWFLQGQSLGPEFRADDGFIPQVGYSEAYGEAGYTLRPEEVFFSRIRLFTVNYYDADTSGALLSRRVSVGAGADGRWNSFTRIELNRDDIRVGSEVLSRFRPRIYFQSSPGRFLNQFTIETYLGDEIDFANAREGRGITLTGTVTLQPTDHLQLTGAASGRWLNVTAADGHSGRLFRAEVERMRAVWAFNSRAFVRLIGQYVSTVRDPTLYTFAVAPKDAAVSGSALFAYKLNWQTVLYLGYGDNRTFSDVTDRYEKNGNQAFTKISYAWQH